MDKSFAELTTNERIAWAASYALQMFVERGGDGLRSAVFAIMSTAQNEAYERGILEGQRREKSREGTL